LKNLFLKKNNKRVAAYLLLNLFISGVLGSTAYAQTQSQNGPDFRKSIQQLGQSLQNDGITFSSRYLGEFAANPAGGAEQGTAFAGELNLNTTLNMYRLANIPGGFMHIQFVDRMGQNLTGQSINNSVQVQQIFGSGQTYQLSILTYQQRLFNNRVDIYAGRTDIANDFIISPLYCFFQSNNICGHPSNYQKDTQISSNPAAVWGGRILVAPTRHLYFKLGLYQTDPSLNPYANHGFNFSVVNSGFSVPFELGYVGSVDDRLVPNHYDVGVIFNRSSYSAAFFDPTSPTQYGRTLVYVEAQRRLFQQKPNSRRGIYGFTAALLGASGEKQQSDYQLVLGGVWEGPFDRRPNDNLAMMVTDTHYNHDFLDSLFQTRRAEGGTEFPHANLVMGELNYTVLVNKWLNFTPNIQYIINPDGLGSAKFPKSNLADAFVVGFQFNISLSALAGLPPVKPAPQTFLEFSRAE